MIQHAPSTLPETPAYRGTKRRILECSLGVFADKGFAGASIRALAEHVGITSASLYAHFPSKESILAALVQIGSAELSTQVHAAAGTEGTPAERVERIIVASAYAHASYPLLAKVVNTERGRLAKSETADAVALIHEAAQVLRKSLREGSQTGELFAPDVEVTARVLEGMAQYVCLWPDLAGYSPREVADLMGQQVQGLLRVTTSHQQGETA